MPRVSSPARSPNLRDPVALGREVIAVEAAAVAQLADRLGPSFSHAVERVLACAGSVIVTGIGKAGLVGQKISATLASTGTRSYFLHPTEALHGDLGRVEPHDLLLVLSFSGETEEITTLLPAVKQVGGEIIAVTARPTSTLGKQAACVLELGSLKEACPLGLAPSASTAAMMALGDALALVVSQLRGFAAEDFARLHPGGSLGRKLSTVDAVMRPLAECRVAAANATVREIFVEQGRPGRRSGAIMLVDPRGKLAGIFTDSDLARLLERKQDAAIDGPISAVMTASPKTVTRGTKLSWACELLAEKKISELPVVDELGRPCGLLDITDVVGISFPVDTDSAIPPPVLKIHDQSASQTKRTAVPKKGRKRT
jgi:arabinose-5-phosphate isomerase